ncbi:MAG TPA: FG-GAP-like repeat-containing protein [Terriglobia bacterium]|nr:FG-GAP-like repeat-containing protein [Terriglobia bacterium]
MLAVAGFLTLIVDHAARSTPAATREGSGDHLAAAGAVSPVDVQRFRNLGKAYYEQGKYDDAVEQFEKVVGAGDAFATDHLDLGLALLQDNQLNQALAELTTARQMDAKLLAVHYNLGVLYKRELRYPDAEAEFRHVTGSDPRDPAAWFNLGTVCFAEKKLPEALDAFERVTTMGFGRGQNFYVAATFHVFTILTRLRRPEDAQKYLKINQQFRDKVPSISIQYPALEAGRYGAIIVPPAALAASAIGATPPTLVDIASRLGLTISRQPKPPKATLIKAGEYSLSFARQSILPQFPASVAIGDYDGDGHLDMYIVRPAGRNQLLHNNGKGGFTDVTEKAGVPGDGRGISAVFADYDNSGHPSLLVAGLGGVTVYHNHGDGTFTDVTAKSGLTANPGELDTHIIAFDSDSDGFLDILTTVYTNLSDPPHKAAFRFPDDFGGGATHLYRNNGDTTFSDVTASSGLRSVRGKMRSAVFADFNDDGYADLVFLREDAPPLLYLNQGQDRFENATSAAGPDFEKVSAVDAQVADLNHDGNFDLVLWSPKGYSVLWGKGNARFQPAAFPPPLPLGQSNRFGALGTVADLDGNGFEDLIAFDNAGHLHTVLNQAGQFRQSLEIKLVSASNLAAAPVALIPSSLVNPSRLDLVAAAADDGFHVFEGPPERWAQVTLDGYKSNKAGVGCAVEFKSGDYYEKLLATGNPVRVFTGNVSKLDVIRVTWPNLIVENSIDVAADSTTNVRESERLASSCPFLYAWNGRRYVFLSDIMGVAPIGELAPDGTRIRPNPDQVVRLGTAPRAQNGKLTLQVTSEMRETDYFDELRLAAIDHPASLKVYASEIYSSSPAAPEMYALGEERPLASAVDDRGHNVLHLLREVDGRYPTGFRRDRILGLADPHALILDLGYFPASAHPALWLTGWVFWTDSNASRSLESNRKLSMISPYLQVRDKRGHWVTVIADMGLPSGTNRTFRVDLDGKFLSNDHHVRIVTSLCVYWDRIFLTLGDRRLTDPFGVGGFTASEQGAEGSRANPLQARFFELPLSSADLHYRGFSRPVVDPRHLHPDDFDYTRKLARAPWNPFAGRYTRYGGVEDLVSAADDRLVVMAAGDELTLRFDAAKLPPIRPEWRRDYFLYARGYAKDGEPNTAYFRTSDPLPFYRMSNYPYAAGERASTPAVREYLNDYETRPGYQLIPALAPPQPNYKGQR